MAQTRLKNEFIYDTEELVRELYRHVLRRDTVSEEEVRYWSDHLRASGDPVDLIYRFTRSEENEKRLRLEQESRTQYPHGHFYSPVTSVKALTEDRRRIFAERAPAAVDLNYEDQRRTLRVIARHFASLPFTDQPKAGNRFHYDNTSYGFGDAVIYWGMIAAAQPKRLIEIGSGFTSALALDAVERLNLDTACTFIDPFPGLLLQTASPIKAPHKVIAQPVQSIDPGIVSELGENDILFIDSSHIVKTGSDVHFELTELLPRLAKGVIVHFHDIFYPFEYPEDWVIRDNKSWNELYFIHSFLMFNPAFKIIYFNHCIAKTRPDWLEEVAPEATPRLLLNPGGGLWLRRV